MGIVLVAKNEFKRSLKYKKKLILSLVIPVIAVIIAVAINSFMKPSINVGVIDKQSGTVCEEFKEKASSIKGLKIKEAKKESINTDMILGKYAFVIEFSNNKNIKISSLDSNFKKNTEEVMKCYFINGDLKGFEDILVKMQNESMTVAQRAGGFILLTLIVTCTMSACNIIKDKEEGTLKRVLISPEKPMFYIVGAFLYNLLNTIAQIIISVVILELLPINIGISGVKLIVIGLVIALIATSISSLIVSLCNSELKAGLMASVVGLVMSLLGGSFLPLEKMPTVLKYISNGTITKWLIVFIEKLQKGIINTASITPICIILVLSMLMIFVSCKCGEKKFA